MLFSSDPIDRFLGWFILVCFVAFVGFMLFLNDGTRAIFGFLVFHYLFGAVLHFAGKTGPPSLVYDAVDIVVELLWKRDR